MSFYATHASHYCHCSVTAVQSIGVNTGRLGSRDQYPRLTCYLLLWSWPWLCTKVSPCRLTKQYWDCHQNSRDSSSMNVCTLIGFIYCIWKLYPLTSALFGVSNFNTSGDQPNETKSNGVEESLVKWDGGQLSTDERSGLVLKQCSPAKWNLSQMELRRV